MQDKIEWWELCKLRGLRTVLRATKRGGSFGRLARRVSRGDTAYLSDISNANRQAMPAVCYIIDITCL